MSGMSFNQKTFKPTAPDKGSFPLDHEGLCKGEMLSYMKCLRLNRFDNGQCRQETKTYLGCRMEHQLMTKEPWSKLGLDEVDTMDKKKKVLVGCSGSVATIKLGALLSRLLGEGLEVEVVMTKCALHFLKSEEMPERVRIWRDEEEWAAWKERGDPVLHIELGKWADLFLIAPLDANTLSKLSTGLCDNLLTCVARAWDLKKPFVFCPAMNTRMYEHPLTSEQLDKIKSFGYTEVPVVSKTLICGDSGLGAMAEIETIVDVVMGRLL